jgi:hypothetical protein
MSLRVTPYEIILEPLEAGVFPLIREEAEHRGTDTRRRDQFVLLGNVGTALRDMIAEDAPAGALEEYAELLYHGYQFWAFGRRTYALDPALTDALTAPAARLGTWLLAGPPAAYVQLPYQRLWARVSAEAPFEPVDGFFVVVDETLPAPDSGAHLRVQLVLGFRPGRPGVSLVSYRTDLDPRDAARHADEPWREAGPPFSNLLPGGERRSYRTIATVSELEALVLRTLHHLDRRSDALLARPAGTAHDDSHLPYVDVRP